MEMPIFFIPYHVTKETALLFLEVEEIGETKVTRKKSGPSFYPKQVKQM